MSNDESFYNLTLVDQKERPAYFGENNLDLTCFQEIIEIENKDGGSFYARRDNISVCKDIKNSPSTSKIGEILGYYSPRDIFDKNEQSKSHFTIIHWKLNYDDQSIELWCENILNIPSDIFERRAKRLQCILFKFGKIGFDRITYCSKTFTTTIEHSFTC